jgi:hypothetical protein
MGEEGKECGGRGGKGRAGTGHGKKDYCFSGGIQIQIDERTDRQADADNADGHMNSARTDITDNLARVWATTNAPSREIVFSTTNSSAIQHKSKTCACANN